MGIYKLVEEFSDINKCILLESDKDYTEQEFNDLITDVCTEYWGETETDSEIAEKLVEHYDFHYVGDEAIVVFLAC